MITTLRRIAVILLTSSGVITATTLTAHVGRHHFQPLPEPTPQLTGKEPITMLRSIRRITLILASSTGIIATTSLTANAASGMNHCQTRSFD